MFAGVVVVFMKNDFFYLITFIYVSGFYDAERINTGLSAVGTITSVNPSVHFPSKLHVRRVAIPQQGPPPHQHVCSLSNITAQSVPLQPVAAEVCPLPELGSPDGFLQRGFSSRCRQMLIH